MVRIVVDEIEMAFSRGRVAIQVQGGQNGSDDRGGFSPFSDSKNHVSLLDAPVFELQSSNELKIFKSF